MYIYIYLSLCIYIYIYICTIDVSYPIFEVALKMETSATPQKYEEHNGTHDIRSSGPKTPHSHHTLSARRAFFAAPGPHDGATGCLKNGVSLCNWRATRVRPPSVMCVGLYMFLNVHECF